MDENLEGFVLLAGATMLGGLALCMLRRPAVGTGLILLALLLRIGGSHVRYEVLVGYYSGVGDAMMYYSDGLILSERLWRSGPWDAADFLWASGNAQWWGTQFIRILSGIVLGFIGPTIRGEFLIFSLASFLGLYALVGSVRVVRSQPEATEFARWLWLWPSLCFWPSSVGKESVLLLAIGLTVFGHIGRSGRTRWAPFLAGTGLAFSVRPHVAALLAISCALAHWLSPSRRLSVWRVLEGLVLVGLGALAIRAMSSQFGLSGVDLEGVQEFIGQRSELTRTGGSNIGGAPPGAAGIPVALANAWMRPFPWEAHNLTAALSSVELLFLWWQVWRRRRSLRQSLLTWRQDPLLRFALPFLLGYSLMIGLTFSNLGIIARQRTLATPFLLMVLVLPAARGPAVKT